MKFDKLVRDRIPEIIRGKGEVAVVHVADEVEYRERLKAKLQEELDEFLASESLEELADVLEVMYAWGTLAGSSPAALEALRSKKAAERGGFTKRIVLDETN